jgi:hypothetical protein
MTMLIVDYLNFANVPKDCCIILVLVVIVSTLRISLSKSYTA